MSEIPAHLRPDACYVCGHGQHPNEGHGHNYWCNADAEAELARQPWGSDPAEGAARRIWGEP